MATKRKANDHGGECSCHDSKFACERAAKLEKHLTMMSKGVLCSEFVHVFIGQEQQKFCIHKDLITLHSTYFSNLLRRKHRDDKIFLPHLKAMYFATFNSWIYSGADRRPMIILSWTAFWADVWMLGSFLQASGFQNYCMDSIIRDEKIAVNGCLSIDIVRAVYQSTTKNAMPRKFIADLLNWKNPFQGLKESSKDWKDWESLLQDQPDLGSDMAKSAWKKWTESHPWDCEQRASYMVKEPSLEMRWKQQTMAERSSDEIFPEAEKK